MVPCIVRARCCTGPGQVVSHFRYKSAHVERSQRCGAEALFKRLSHSLGSIEPEPERSLTRSLTDADSAKARDRVDVECLVSRIKQISGRPAVSRARAACGASQACRRSGRADLYGEAHSSGSHDQEAADALDHHLEQALKFRDKTFSKEKEGLSNLNDAAAVTGGEAASDGAAPHGSGTDMECRLFHQVKEGHLSVQFESEFSQTQQEQLRRAGAAGQALQRSKGTFADLTEAVLQNIVVGGAAVQAYASLATKTAAKRVRPVSKQVNLGPRKIIRCGWGGQGPGPLEALAKQERAKAIFQSLIH